MVFSLVVFLSGWPATATPEVSLELAAPEISVDAYGVLVSGISLEGVEARKLPSREGREVLRVVARDPSQSGATKDLPALLGSFRIESEGLRFQPRFPPAPGLLLDVHFDGAAWERWLRAARDPAAASAEPVQTEFAYQNSGSPSRTPDATLRWLVPDPANPTTARVLEVSPSGTVPANLLRLYVHFSEPMSARHVLEHVKLIDPDGAEIETAFVDVPGGLWDPERRRLTLFIHPGRVKRGVGPNQALGPVLEVGESYHLRIASDARDAQGRGLESDFEARFEVGEADRRSPDPSLWRLRTPSSPSGSLVALLDQPADTALLARMLRVVTEADETVPASVGVAADGLRVEIEPASPWQPGRYRLVIPAALEDPAGNRIDRLFEEAPASEEEPAPAVELEFTVEPGL